MTNSIEKLLIMPSLPARIANTSAYSSVRRVTKSALSAASQIRKEIGIEFSHLYSMARKARAPVAKRSEGMPPHESASFVNEQENWMKRFQPIDDGIPSVKTQQDHMRTIYGERLFPSSPEQ
jgi:hypothetical protein